MRILYAIALATLVATLLTLGADWPTQNGSPQRDGWARAEKAFTVENASHIELLYKYKAENKTRGPEALTTPIVNGMLITYLGFKEMLVFGGSSDNVYSIDADLNRIIWKVHFEYKGEKPESQPTAACPGGLTAAPAMPGSASAASGRGFAGPGRGAGGLFATGFGRSGVFIAVSGDGYLHALNTSTGADKVAPVKFLPANSRVSALNINNSIIYAATSGSCGGNANGIYALDMSGEGGAVSSFMTDGEGASGTAIGADGTVYAQTDRGLFALSKDLKLKGSLATPLAGGITPIVFSWKGKDVVVAAGKDRLYEVNAETMTSLQEMDGVTGGPHGSFASWEEAPGGARWIYAGTGNTVAGFSVEAGNGPPKMVRAWTSPAKASPDSLITANGLIFALANGTAPAGHATLTVLNGATGKELYSYAAASYGHNASLAVANRRIYFTDHTNTAYCLGFMADQPQLTGR